VSASHQNEPAIADPPRRSRFQFSLSSLLLVALIVASLAAFWRERAAHLRVKRSLRGAVRESKQHLNAMRALQARHQRAGADPVELQVEDRSQIYVKAYDPGIGSREGDGWAWKVYVPPGREIWLYVSQGSKWDAEQGKYIDGAVSGSLIKLAGEQSLWGCLTKDREGGAYIQLWTEDGSHCARLSDEGYAIFRAAADSVRETSGDTAQALLSPSTIPHGRMPLFRWHRAGKGFGPANSSEYGFSLYLVDETPPGR
jgi:hypothetical protein